MQNLAQARRVLNHRAKNQGEPETDPAYGLPPKHRFPAKLSNGADRERRRRVEAPEVTHKNERYRDMNCLICGATAINWNDWSSSIGTGDRHHVVRAAKIKPRSVPSPHFPVDRAQFATPR